MRKTTEFSRVKPENVWVFCGNQVRKVNSGGKHAVMDLNGRIM